MSTSKRVSDQTKQMPEELKGDDETFYQDFKRFVLTDHQIEMGAWSEQEAERARAVINRSRERFE